jgi:hypothetical protein
MIDFKWETLIELYYAGDSIGAVAEGASPGVVSFDDAMKGLQRFPRGTDESDIARLFLNYCNEVGKDGFSVTGWYSYHSKNRGAAKYGNTWKDHFVTVDYILKKKGTLDYEHLIALSRDRGSNGNGCLALAYPIVKKFPGKAPEMAERITVGTHYLARPTMQLAVSFFLGNKTLQEIIDEAFPNERSDGWDLSPLSCGCLWAAATIAQEDTAKDVIKAALANGGDVDSYLSLGLLMWGVQRESHQSYPNALDTD